MPGRKTIQYKDYYSFNGGMNNSMSEDSLRDDELVVCENMIIKADGSLQTRYGTKPIHNPVESEATKDYDKINVTRRYEYIAKGKTYLLEVINKKLYDVTDCDFYIGGMPTISPSAAECYLCDINNEYPTFIQQQDVLYVFDGLKIYEIGQKDYFSNSGTVDIKVNEIVEISYDYNDSNLHGKYFKSKTNRTGVNLNEETYTNTTNWEEVTTMNKEIREVKSYDPSKKEKAGFTFFGSATQAGKFEFSINNETYSIETTSAQANADAVTFAAYIKTKAAEAMVGKYTVTNTGATVTFEAIESGFQTDLYLLDNTTKITCVAITNTQGKDNDNIYDEVCSCTIFAKHTKSARYVASGNPKKPYAVYFSEPNQVNYWKNINVLAPTTGEGKAVCLVDILGSMLVGYNKSWYEYNGLDPGTDGTWRRLAIPYGCIAKNSVQILDLYHFIFLGYNGLNVVSSNMLFQYGATLNNDTGLDVVTSGKTKNEVMKIVKPESIVSVFRNNIYYIAYKSDISSEYNDRILTYDTKKKAFTLFTGLYVNDFLYRYDGHLEIASIRCSLRYQDTEKGVQGAEGYGLETTFFQDYDYLTNKYKKIVYRIVTGILKLCNAQSQNFIDKIHLKFTQKIQDETKHIMAIAVLDERKYEYPLLSNMNNFVWGSNWGNVWGVRQVELQSFFIRQKCQNIHLEITNKDTDYIDSDIEFMGFMVSYKPFIPYQYISNLKFV